MSGSVCWLFEVTGWKLQGTEAAIPAFSALLGVLGEFDASTVVLESIVGVSEGAG